MQMFLTFFSAENGAFFACNVFEILMLSKDIVSFEQLGPGHICDFFC